MSFLRCFVHNIPRLPCSEILLFAKHYLLGVLGSRLRAHLYGIKFMSVKMLQRFGTAFSLKASHLRLFVNF
jgi:hypothetical protein